MVLLYDARGHGRSSGEKVSAGFLEVADLLGAIDFLKTQGATNVGCLGVSQGGATVLLSADKLPTEVNWAIVESVYPTMGDALDRRFRKDLRLPGWLAGALFVPFAEHRLGIEIDQISPIDQIGKLHCPVFVIGGTEDQHTLATSTQSIFSAAPEPKQLWLVPGAAHVDLYGFAKKTYADRILEFVSSRWYP
jgi:fermentation-respiration switch protein FrsA (DUF1100 family)